MRLPSSSLFPSLCIFVTGKGGSAFRYALEKSVRAGVERGLGSPRHGRPGGRRYSGCYETREVRSRLCRVLCVSKDGRAVSAWLKPSPEYKARWPLRP